MYDALALISGFFALLSLNFLFLKMGSDQDESFICLFISLLFGVFSVFGEGYEYYYFLPPIATCFILVVTKAHIDEKRFHKNR